MKSRCLQAFTLFLAVGLPAWVGCSEEKSKVIEPPPGYTIPTPEEMAEANRQRDLMMSGGAEEIKKTDK